MNGRRWPTWSDGAVGSTPTYAPMGFSVSTQSSVFRSLCSFSNIPRRERRMKNTTCTYPATSFTKPRSSRTLSMLCCAPALIVPARSAHAARSACPPSSPCADVYCLRIHCRHKYCGRRGRCLSNDMVRWRRRSKEIVHVGNLCLPRLKMRSLAQACSSPAAPPHLRTSATRRHLTSRVDSS